MPYQICTLRDQPFTSRIVASRNHLSTFFTAFGFRSAFPGDLTYTTEHFSSRGLHQLDRAGLSPSLEAELSEICWTHWPEKSHSQVDSIWQGYRPQNKYLPLAGGCISQTVSDNASGPIDGVWRNDTRNQLTFTKSCFWLNHKCSIFGCHP